MNQLLTCLLLTVFRVIICHAQTQPVFRIDSLPPQGILLDKGWKWQAGDNPAWAKPAFDDSKWERIDPTQDINQLTQIRKAGSGWLRVRLQIDSSLNDKIVSIVSDQSVASEFYWDGRLIGSFGQLSSNPENVKAYNPIGTNTLHQVIHFYTGNSNEHVFAVRFAVEPIAKYRDFWGVKDGFLKVSFFLSDASGNTLRKENQYEKRGEIDFAMLDYFKSGVFLILSVLHLFIFFSYRKQKANLYFGFFCFLSFFIFQIQVLVEQYFHYITERQYYIAIVQIVYFTTRLLLLTAVYTLFSYRNRHTINILIALIIIYLTFDTINFSSPYYIGITLVILMNLEIVRVSILAYKNKKDGAYLLLAGSLIYIVFNIHYFYTLSNPSNLILLHFSFNVSNFGIPISITLFLARDFAQTTRSLALKLKENEALFVEKQHILATQNETLEKQVNERTAQLNQSLANLKTTQNQLIQKEKLASLGELTAGIAHEIQNPLNFVNNFAEVSVELADELHQSVEENDKPLSQELAVDLRQNMQQIAHNGQRASNIVRAMLEHSSASTGQREPTNLNALAEEYLKLAYHGFRRSGDPAKHSGFTANLQTDFAADLPLVEVVGSDVGRVLLNLYNNAFYALRQRQLQENTDATEIYEPSIWVSTQRVDGQVEMRVRDNGSGIPAGIREKVFQPFFTTKPTGQGTGLGLSLSYDIITKGHGGEMWVESQEGQGSIFIVKLPLHQ
ncbi:sensor histidine kinase [Spirosoma arcticum]